MSCHYDLHCVDCSTPTVRREAGLEFNHAPEAVALALKLRTGFEAMGALLDGLEAGADRDAYRWTDTGAGRTPLVEAARFFAAHAGHRIVVMDEYGRIWNRCQKDVAFGCGHRHACVRTPGHSGDCSIHEDKTEKEKAP